MAADRPKRQLFHRDGPPGLAQHDCSHGNSPDVGVIPTYDGRTTDRVKETCDRTTSTLATLTIGGEPQPGAAGSYPVHNPARPAEVVGHAPAADRAQLDAAVTRARAAPGWRALDVAERVAEVAGGGGDGG